MPEIIAETQEFIQQVTDYVLKKYSDHKIAVLVDENTEKFCFPIVRGIFNDSLIKIKSGENRKNINSCTKIWKYLIDNNFDKKSLLVILGGGVLCDIGSFAACIYKRGIPYILLPTTLLAQADAAWGGKNGVNFNGLKNQLGLINMPDKTFINIDFLQTLPFKHYQSGLAEIIKIMFVGGSELKALQRIKPTTRCSDPKECAKPPTKRLRETNHIIYYKSGNYIIDKDYIKIVLEKSIEYKNHLVSKDINDNNDRKVLNFGHTIGHAVEAVYKQKYSHGQCVAYGMLVAFSLSKDILGFAEAKYISCTKLIRTLIDIPTIEEKDITTIISKAKKDKKNTKGNNLFVLLEDIGKPAIDVVISDEEITRAIQSANTQLNKIQTIEVDLPFSKSILNRLLILNYLYGSTFSIHSKNTPDDCKLLYQILKKGIPPICNCDNSGVVFRFITTIAAVQKQGTIITGSNRLCERPCKDLIDTLRALGAKIEYLQKEGFPPVKINSLINLQENISEINVKSDISSQYASALMLVAPLFSNGLKINIGNNVVSYPYILMTSKMMNEAGLSNSVTNNTITVDKFCGNYNNNKVVIEKDWTALSSWLPILLATNTSIYIKNICKASKQGDIKILDYLHYLNIEYVFQQNNLLLCKTKAKNKEKTIEINLKDNIDLFPALAVSFVIGGIEVYFSGLDNLKWKESDRLHATINNLELLGYKNIKCTNNTLFIGKQNLKTITKPITLKSYQDHRIVMAFYVFALIYKNVTIDDTSSISKSYPFYLEEIVKFLK